MATETATVRRTVGAPASDVWNGLDGFKETVEHWPAVRD
jgi:hypothetical protein